MPEHFHLVLEGGDAAYWSILLAMRDAGFEVLLDFQPKDPLSWRMTIRPSSSRDVGMFVEEVTPVVEILVPAHDLLADQPIAQSADFTTQNVYGLNLAILKMILREWLTAAIIRGGYTIEEAVRLFAALKLE